MTIQIPATPPLPGATLVSTANTALAAIAGSPQATLASASTTDLGSVDTANIELTGAVTITSFGSNANLLAGQFKFIRAVNNPGPILTYNAVSLITVTGADIQMMPSDVAFLKYLGSGNWQMMAFFRALQRQKLLADTTFYVRTDGSDTNNGLSNSSAGAWLTLQRAINILASLYDFNNKNITVQVGAGSYAAGVNIIPWTGGGTLTWTGDTGTPANVAVTGSFTVGGGAMPGSITLQGFKTINGGVTVNVPAFVNLGAWEFGVNAGGVHIFPNSPGCTVNITANYTISGNATFHSDTAWGSKLFNQGSHTVTLTGTPAFTTFAINVYGGVFYAAGLTYSGSATGKRFEVDSNGIIDTQSGASATFFPGNSAGTTATGGQYL